MLDPISKDQFQGLVEKFTELLVGEATPELVENVTYWALYNHIHKTMPALTQHWTQEHPEGKAAVRHLFEEIKRLHQSRSNQGPASTSD
ncbi:DUF2573 family protein [Paenibacillus turpanensis]|uniref:DUF2573 family protein n=1 Tax=Paenibacillus turpanensis TaxID=2689078 RepID=UPI00140D09A3|nr:DUF2573 family protein [Paenibacillus turpanensis]